MAFKNFPRMPLNCKMGPEDLKSQSKHNNNRSNKTAWLFVPTFVS